MAKLKIALLIFLAVLIAGAGFYFRDEIAKVCVIFNKDTLAFRKIDVGSVINKIGNAVLTPPPLNIGGSYTQVVLVKSSVVAETNSQRALNNLPALKENSKLQAAAVAKANDMFKNQYFEHVSPSGLEPGQLVQNYGYDYIVAGENLILGNFKNEKEVVANWMASPGHRANILNSRYTEIGVAIIKGAYKGGTAWIGVQEFGLPLASCPEPNSNLKTQIDTSKAQLDLLSVQIISKKDEVESANQRSAYYSQLISDYNKLIVKYNSLAEDTKSQVAKYNKQVTDFNQCVSNK